MKKLVLLTCLVAIPFSSFAEEGTKKFGLGAKVSTIGLGLDLAYNFNDKFSTRLNLNNSSANYNEKNGDINFTGDLKLSSTGVLVDYHPFSNGFRITGGVYNNKNSLKTVSSSSSTNSEIGGTTYDISDTKINLETGFKSTAPYFGLGWGSNKKGLNFSIDAGILLQGSPNVGLAATGTVTANGGADVVNIDNPASSGHASIVRDFKNDLKAEETTINNDLSSFKQYPVIAVGIVYNF